MRGIATTAFAATFALGLAACEQDPVQPGGGDGARMEVVVHGSGDAGGVSQALAPSGAAASASSEASGTVKVRARVFVRTDAGAWIELTRGAAEQTVELASSASGKVLTSAELAARSYTRVRVVFEDVRAQVSGGLQLGVGPFQGEIRLGGTGSTTVERQLEFELRSGTTSRLHVDLNAQTWLQRADLTARVVSEADFAGAVRLRVE